MWSGPVQLSHKKKWFCVSYSYVEHNFKEPVARPISTGPPFHRLKFISTVQIFYFLVMFTLNDIYCIVLKVKGVLCHEHLRKIDWFIDPIIWFSIDNDIFYSVINNDERNGCVFTQRKVFRSLEAFSFTYHVTISCCHFWCETCSL